MRFVDIAKVVLLSCPLLSEVERIRHTFMRQRNTPWAGAGLQTVLAVAIHLHLLSRNLASHVCQSGTSFLISHRFVSLVMGPYDACGERTDNPDCVTFL